MSANVAMYPNVDDPLLACYPPSEKRAILVHKYFLGLELNRDPGLNETVLSWESRIAMRWRTDKLRRDVQAQVAEIEGYRRHRCTELGREIRWEEAAAEWADMHAAAWRTRWEQTPASGA